jgi:hypothetical protein
MGLYKGGGGGGGSYTGTLYMGDLCVSTKQVSHKQENKHVLITRLINIVSYKDNDNVFKYRSLLY